MGQEKESPEVVKPAVITNGKKIELKIEKKSNSNIDKKADIKPNKKADIKTYKKAEIKTDKKAGIKTDKKVEVKTGKKAEIKTDKKVEIKTDQKAEIKTDKKADIKTDKKAEIKKDKKPPTKKKAPIQNDKGAENKAGKKTPYQGTRRCFGFFICTKCKRQWASAASWANVWQKCFSCNTTVYPHKQKKLLRQKKTAKKAVDGNDNEPKHHLEELCEKCRIIGFCCVTIQRAEVVNAPAV